MSGAIMTLSGTAALPPPRTGIRAGAAIVVESRPLASCTDLLHDWTDLARRALAPNPFFDPGFLLAAAQHLVDFRERQVLLAWAGDAEARRRRLVGFLPYERHRRPFRVDRLGGCVDPRLHHDLPLLDAEMAEPALSALLPRLLAGRAQGELVLRGIDPLGPVAVAALKVARRHRLVVDLRAAALPGDAPRAVVPDASGAGLSLHQASGLAEMRDAVEILLALEASGALAREGRAALQDTREAAFLRAMTRQLGRRKLCHVALLMRAEAPVAAALALGKGRRRWLYRAAFDEAADGGTLPVLLAAMRRATPGLTLLTRGDTPLFGARPDLCDLELSTPTRRPADLARRMRERLNRALFRPRRAAAGG